MPGRRRILTLIAVAGLSLAAVPATLADITRDSTGQQRAELNKMELQAFPADAWSKISAWAGGEALTASSTAGKPVLIMTWSSWHPASKKAVALAQRMNQSFGPMGLVVVGIHGPQGWDKAEETAKGLGANFVLGHDANSEFRKALLIDSDPKWYLIDRAGHLRYAAVSTASVEEACAELTAESQEGASDLPKIRKERADQELASKGRTHDIRQNIDLSKLPPVPPGYTKPDDTAYADLKWPKVDKEIGQLFGLVDQQTQKQIEPKSAFAPALQFPRPPVTEGRATVIYFWHPNIYMTYSPVMQQMDQLQRMHSRDITVIGALIPEKSIDASKANTSGQVDEETVEKLQKKFDAFVKTRNFDHTLAIDPGSTCLAGLMQQGGQGFPIPGAMIISTDGTVRWIGWLNRSDFDSALDRVLSTDPGVKARREADRKFIAK